MASDRMSGAIIIYGSDSCFTNNLFYKEKALSHSEVLVIVACGQMSKAMARHPEADRRSTTYPGMQCPERRGESQECSARQTAAWPVLLKVD